MPFTYSKLEIDYKKSLAVISCDVVKYLTDLFIDFHNFQKKIIELGKDEALKQANKEIDSFLDILNHFNDRDRKTFLALVQKEFSQSKYTKIAEHGLDNLILFTEERKLSEATEKLLEYIKPSFKVCCSNLFHISPPFLKHIIENYHPRQLIDPSCSPLHLNKISLLSSILIYNTSSKISDLPFDIQEKLWSQQPWEEAFTGIGGFSEYAMDRQSITFKLNNSKMVLDAFNKYSTFDFPKDPFCWNQGHITKNKDIYKFFTAILKYSLKKKYAFTLNLNEDYKQFITYLKEKYKGNDSCKVKIENAEDLIIQIEQQFLKVSNKRKHIVGKL